MKRQLYWQRDIRDGFPVIAMRLSFLGSEKNHYETDVETCPVSLLTLNKK